MCDPIKVSEWLPGLFGIRDVAGMGTAQQFRWTYKMMGLPFTGKAKCVEYTPNERIVIETTGSIRSTWTWTFEPQRSMTLVNVTLQYTLPIPVIGKACEKLILRQNQREADLAVANIKEKLQWRSQFKSLI